MIRVSPDGHVLICRKNGPIALAKDGRTVTLFEHYELVDAIFDRENQLWLASTNKGLRINLETGNSEELYWNRAVIGLRTAINHAE